MFAVAHRRTSSVRRTAAALLLATLILGGVLPPATAIAEEPTGPVDQTLDVAGVIDPTGIADGANGLIYAAEGDVINAGISFASIAPGGDVLKLGRGAVKYGDEAFGLLDEVAGGGFKLGDDAPAPGTFCSFTPDTLVATPDGDRSIGDIDVGDPVLARNEETGKTSVRGVSAVLRHTDPVTGTVVVDGEAIETTPEHPFFSLDRGFVAAEELRVGELVATASGLPGKVEGVSWDGGPAEMWNLTVDVDHTFFVGERGVWVHNDCDFAVTESGVAIPIGGGKPTVSDTKLKIYVRDLYKPTATIGNGGTADAIRWTKGTGELVGNTDHVSKGIQYSNGLRNWLARPPPGAIADDIATAQRLLDDLTDALNR